MNKQFVILSFAVIAIIIVVMKNSNENSKAQLDDVIANQEVLPKTQSQKLENIKNLDKLADVVNEKTVKLPKKVKEQIKKERNEYDKKQTLTSLTKILEESYLDPQNNVQDIKIVQTKIKNLKKEMKVKPKNTETWDPLLIYYLMIQENYTYSEINEIKSLADNGISKDELEYIKEKITEKPFMDQVKQFKKTPEAVRTIAAYQVPRAPEKDEFIEFEDSSPRLEDKLIEMNYSDEEVMEMQQGYQY